MSPQDREDAWLARRIARAQPGGATAKKLNKLATARVLAIADAFQHFPNECQAGQDALAVQLADAPKGTVRQYIARRGEDRFGPVYRLFNCNEANQTLSEVDVGVCEVPYEARPKADALAGQAFNQVQIFGPPFVWKAKR